MTALDLNCRLAELLGWTNITELSGALLGTPPAGLPECRGQALIPDWAGDWRDCGPLGSAHRIGVEHGDVTVRAVLGHGATRVKIGPFGDRDATARRAIVSSVIAKLEASQ
jgi:hypothetical protein